MRPGEKYKTTGERGAVFQPYATFSKLATKRYERHHQDIPGLVLKLPQKYKATFTVTDLVKKYWASENLDSRKASVIIQIILRCGLLDTDGYGRNGESRRYRINENFMKYIRYIKERS